MSTPADTRADTATAAAGEDISNETATGSAADAAAAEEVRRRAIALLYPRKPHPTDDQEAARNRAASDLSHRMLRLSGTEARMAYLADQLDPEAFAAAAEIVRLSRLSDFYPRCPDPGKPGAVANALAESDGRRDVTRFRWDSYTHAVIACSVVDAILDGVFQGRRDHLRDHMLGVAAKADRRTRFEPWWEERLVTLVDQARAEGLAAGRAETSGQDTDQDTDQTISQAIPGSGAAVGEEQAGETGAEPRVQQAHAATRQLSQASDALLEALDLTALPDPPCGSGGGWSLHELDFDDGVAVFEHDCFHEHRYDLHERYRTTLPLPGATDTAAPGDVRTNPDQETPR